MKSCSIGRHYDIMGVLSEKVFRIAVLGVALFGCVALFVCFKYQSISSDEIWQTVYKKDSLVHPQPHSLGMDGSITTKQNHRTRLLCMIFTTSENWDTKAKAVKNTWASRCYRAVFFYSKVDRELPDAVSLNVSEGRAHLTDKTRAALEWSYDQYRHEIDWFLKADDDAYFLMENLEAFLHQLDLDRPHYIGKNNRQDFKTGYASGGAGYVLNTLAAELLFNGTRTHSADCKSHGTIEDLDVGDCLRAQGVYLESTLDNHQRQRFHCNDPIKVMKNNIGTYYITKGDYVYGKKEDINWMMSPELISFHYVTPENMYVYDYLLYDVQRIPSKS